MMSQMEQFHFHPKCHHLKLTHLCFADDLILCSKGEFSSVYLLLQTSDERMIFSLQEFSLEEIRSNGKELKEKEI